MKVLQIERWGRSETDGERRMFASEMERQNDMEV